MHVRVCVLIAALNLMGCPREKHEADPKARDAQPAASTVPTASARPTASAHDSSNRSVCRLLSGTVSFDGGSLSAPAALSKDELVLNVTEPLVLRDSDGYELTVGKGRATPCARPEEDWLWSGTLSGSKPAGQKAGGERWTVTPFAIFRHADGQIAITVKAKSVTFDVTRGSAHAILAPRARLASKAPSGPATDPLEWLTLGAKAEITSATDSSDSETTSAVIEQCRSHADRAKRMAQEMPEAGSRLSELAANHVRERQYAHAMCNLAWVRWEGGPSRAGDAAESIRRSLTEAEQSYRYVP